MTKVFAASRYGRGTADYLNCPFDKAGYEAFYEALVSAERARCMSLTASRACTRAACPLR